MNSLTRREWIRVGLAFGFVAMAAFCAFEAYLLAYMNHVRRHFSGANSLGVSESRQ